VEHTAWVVEEQPRLHAFSRIRHKIVVLSNDFVTLPSRKKPCSKWQPLLPIRHIFGNREEHHDYLEKGRSIRCSLRRTSAARATIYAAGAVADRVRSTSCSPSRHATSNTDQRGHVTKGKEGSSGGCLDAETVKFLSDYVLAQKLLMIGLFLPSNSDRYEMSSSDTVRRSGKIFTPPHSVTRMPSTACEWVGHTTAAAGARHSSLP